MAEIIIPAGSPVYIDAYVDETLPCAATLEGWAVWLAEPSEAWGREAGAAEGDTFDASCVIVLGDVRVEWGDAGWAAVEPIPDGTEVFYLRWSEGSQGWDVDFSAETLADATDCVEPDDGPLWFACVKDGPDFKVRFRSAGVDRPARLEIIEAFDA